MKESEIRLLIFAKIAPCLFFGLIGLGILIVECTDNTDPIDNSIMKDVEYVEFLDVLDHENNGFRVVYVTKNAVTEKRFDEIQSRVHIREAFARLRKESVIHFGGSLLNVDIHEFARFARQYDCDDQIKIHCINVQGLKKMYHYIGPNPSIPNSARWMDMWTEQGNQWINSNDVYTSSPDVSTTYRYWKCQYPHETSETDEHFSHFSEENRIR